MCSGVTPEDGVLTSLIGVRGGVVASFPKCPYALIPRTCEYVMRHGRKGFAGVVHVMGRRVGEMILHYLPWAPKAENFLWLLTEEWSQRF